MLCAAVFDMDGLMIDSEPLWRLAETEVLGELGVEVTEAMCLEIMGMRTDEVIDLWYRRFRWSGPTPAEVGDRLQRRMLDLIRDRGARMPGLEHALATCEEAGFTLAVASSSTPTLIAATLAALGVADRFATTCSAVEVARGKPAPEVFLLAAERLGVPPTSCLVLEDSVAGVAAARAAGMRVIAVPTHEVADAAGFGGADLVLGSLEELSAEHVNRLAAGIL